MTLPSVVLVVALAGLHIPASASRGTASWSWRASAVDPADEHLELRFGSSETGGWADWVSVVRVGRPVGRVFPVQFLLPTTDASYADAITAVRRDLDFYLIEPGKRDPWKYAIYHTGTMANVYSRVHWGHIRPQSLARASSLGRADQ